MIVFLCLLFFATGALAQGEADHPRDLNIPTLAPYTPPKPDRFELEGGPTLLVLTDTRLPLVDGVGLFKLGSVLDPTGKTGLVELLAECIRTGGSKELPGPELDHWLEAHGALLQLRTEPEYVLVEFSCLSEHAAELIEIVRSLLREPLLPENVIENARARMLSAIDRERDNTSALADRMLLRAAYGADSPYARTPSSEELASITRADLLEFHAAHFGANRLVLGLAGNVDSAAVSQLIGQSFAGWKATGGTESASAPAFMQPRSRVVQIIDRPGVTQTELRLSAPGVRRLHPDYAALSLWSHAIGAGGAANRMMVRVRTELGLAYTVGAYYRAGWKTAGRFEGWCGTSNDTVGEALTAMLDVLDDSRLEFEAEELEAVRSRLIKGRVFDVDTPSEVLERNLLLEFYGYPSNFHQRVEEKLRTLGAAEVAAAVERHLDLDRLIVVAVGPAENIASALEEFGEITLLNDRGEPWTEPELPEVGQLFDSLGGRELWANLSTLHRRGVAELPTSNGPFSVPGEYWQSMSPNRSRTDVAFAGAKTTIVISPDSCFSLNADNIEDLPADQCRVRRAKGDGNLYRLLHLLARDEVDSVRVDDAKRLVIEFETGLVCTLHRDENGRPKSLRTNLEGSEEFWEFLEWSETRGMPWFSKARERNLGTEVSTTLFEYDVEVDDKLFRDPRQ